MNEMTIAELCEELRCGTRVILQVRHAERPKMDPDDPTFGDALSLTKEGARTARLLGQALAEFRDDVTFWSSPLTRTRETAACIAAGMGVADPEIRTDEQLGNGSFFYEDPLEVLKLFKEKEFFKACFEYFEKGKLPGLKEINAAADTCERWLSDRLTGRLLIAATHDCYIAAFLSARGAVEKFSRKNWTRFLDGGAILIAPDGSRRYALVRANLSHGICGVRTTKGLVFDFGGVMTTTTMPERVRKITDELGIPWQTVADGFRRYRLMMDGGFIDVERLYDLIWADADIVLAEADRQRIVEADTASFLYRNEEMLAWMKALKAKGYRIGILTNMPPAFAAEFRKAFPDFIALADAMVISGEEHMFKPQRRIYDLLAERIGLGADELCFFDDSEANCLGALEAGWHAIRFASVAQAAREFEERFG